MDLRGHLDLLLLATMAASGPAHGYALITALRDRSEGTFDLPEGTVYPALHRLERVGAVSSSWFLAEGRRRRVYQLTKKGHAALAQRRDEWTTFSNGMKSVIAPFRFGAESWTA